MSLYDVLTGANHNGSDSVAWIGAVQDGCSYVSKLTNTEIIQLAGKVIKKRSSGHFGVLTNWGRESVFFRT